MRPVISNVVSHPVTCPPAGFPSHGPLYAEDELQVNPYPLVAGYASEVSVRLTNLSASPLTVGVQFQISPLGLGAGLPYTTFDTRTATIPASSNLILKSAYASRTGGLACFQVLVTIPGTAQVLKTQSCLDNIEDFSGQPPYPPLTFPVGNPTAAIADISLVVDNTCPGWSASNHKSGPPVLIGVGPNDTDIRSATLQVTPPSPAVLGSGCHIDVQAWIINPATGAAQLIGGIRKLDIPPVHLPANVTPPWEENEIVFMPDPPQAGVPGQLCIVLSNPLGVPKTVTVEFDVADFGAGIGFTPIATQAFTLPPHSLGTYCIPWTPAASGTLHRCILVTLKQSGYQDMRSQRNVDIVRTSSNLGSLDIPFMIGNPDLVDHALTFDLSTFGLDPYWMPVIQDDMGGLPPAMLMAGERRLLHLRFVPAMATCRPSRSARRFPFRRRQPGVGGHAAGWAAFQRLYRDAGDAQDLRAQDQQVGFFFD